MDEYVPRIVDNELDELLTGLPAIAIEGPRAVGKTETALQRAKTVYRLDDARHQEILRAEPERLVTGIPPILIDEWQRTPHSWDLVRRAVDRSRSCSLRSRAARATASPFRSASGNRLAASVHTGHRRGS